MFNAAAYNFDAMSWRAKGGEVNSEYHRGGVQSELFANFLKDFLNMVFFMVLPFNRKISH
jgi:hypothetical protein